MNGIDKIIARMEADTQAECADIAAQAAAEAEAILAQYRACLLYTSPSPRDS